MATEPKQVILTYATPGPPFPRRPGCAWAAIVVTAVVMGWDGVESLTHDRVLPLTDAPIALAGVCLGLLLTIISYFVDGRGRYLSRVALSMTLLALFVSLLRGAEMVLRLLS
jgi:hypothetical protein